jgi:hypothetical protein
LKRKNNIFLIFFLFFSTITFAQKQDSTSRSGRRGEIVVPTQVVDSQKVVVAIDTSKIDSTKKNKFKNFFSKANYSPKKAMLLSFVLPGAGQVYNKTGWYWKMPLCYAAYGATGYNLIYNRRRYKFYDDIYINYIIDPKYINDFSKDVAKNRRATYKKRTEQAWVGLFGAHLFCVADAFVTAHLNQFDTDENLNFSISPSQESLGLSFKLNF